MATLELAACQMPETTVAKFTFFSICTVTARVRFERDKKTAPVSQSGHLSIFAG